MLRIDNVCYIQMLFRVQHIRIVRMFGRTYHANIVDHYESPRNVGSLSKTDTDVGVGLVGAPSCGDVVSLSIRVNKDTNTIMDAKIKVFGCGSAIASGSYTTEIIKGMQIDAASKVTNKSIAKYLNLPPVKLHCSMLAEDAIKAAIQDYRRKQE
jgi:Fe-S cluster assembly scaffold IscU